MVGVNNISERVQGPCRVEFGGPDPRPEDGRREDRPEGLALDPRMLDLARLQRIQLRHALLGLSTLRDCGPGFLYGLGEEGWWLSSTLFVVVDFKRNCI